MKNHRILMALAAVLLATATGQSLRAAELVMPTGYGENLFQTRNVRQFAADARAASSGKLAIDVRDGGKLLPMNRIRAAVESGEVPMGEFILSGEAATDPLFALDALPFLTQSYDDAELLWKLSRPLVEAALRRRNLELLYAVPWPPQGLYANRALERTKDLAGLRLRTYNAATEKLAHLVSAQPVAVPLPELRVALGGGRLDLLLTSATSGVDTKAWEHLKYYYDVRAWFPKNVVVINSKVLAGLSNGERDALLSAAREAERRGWQLSKAQDTSDQMQLKAGGMRVELPSPELSSGLQRAGEKLVREYLQSAGGDVLSVLLSYNMQRGAWR